MAKNELEGLEVTSLKKEWSKLCSKHRKLRMEALPDREVLLCSAGVSKVGELTTIPGAGGSAPVTVPALPRKRGRPKGTGKRACKGEPSCIQARTPKMKASCSDVKWVRVREKKSNKTEYRCRCSSSGNQNYAPNKACEKAVGPKPRG